MLNVIRLNVIMHNDIILNVIMLNVIMLNVLMLNVIMPNVIMLNVIMIMSQIYCYALCQCHCAGSIHAEAIFLVVCDPSMNKL